MPCCSVVYYCVDYAEMRERWRSVTPASVIITPDDGSCAKDLPNALAKFKGSLIVRGLLSSYTLAIW